MTAVSRGPVTAFLLRAGLLTAILAIIAGIFGMHIMTGAHNMTGAHSMPVAAADTGMGEMHSTPASHAGHGTELSPYVAITAQPVTGSSSSCAPAGSCHEMSAGGNACVLAPGNTSLAAALSGAAAYSVPDLGRANAAGTDYSFSPDSPSPGDLCISRT